jgi:hypothetical protein
MKKVFVRPSPAMGVAIVALIVALGGTAIAGGVLNKKKVNKIITNRAPGLSVSHAKTADSATNATNATNATTASNLTPPEAFHVLGAGDFQNGWVAFGGGGSTPGFYKDQLGVVHLRGELKSGTSSNTATGDMFTLPAGYRPAENQQFRGGDATGTGNIAVQSTGEVRALAGTGNVLLSVDGFTFRAGA